MAIVTPSYRPKRAPRKKRKQPEIANRIVTPAPLKPRKGPVIRLDDVPSRESSAQPQRAVPAIVEPKRTRSRFGAVPEMTEEEHQQRGEAAEALFRELVRRAAGDG